MGCRGWSLVEGDATHAGCGLGTGRRAQGADKGLWSDGGSLGADTPITSTLSNASRRRFFFEDEFGAGARGI